MMFSYIIPRSREKDSNHWPKVNLFVVDLNNRIIEYDLANTFVQKWGSFGNGNGQFNIPYAVAIDSNASVYVADTLNKRIQKFVRMP